MHQIVLLLENHFRLETEHEKLRRRGFNKNPNREGDSYVDHAPRTQPPWDFFRIMSLLNGILLFLYVQSPMRWLWKKTLEKFGEIAILKYLIENFLQWVENNHCQTFRS